MWQRRHAAESAPPRAARRIAARVSWLAFAVACGFPQLPNLPSDGRAGTDGSGDGAHLDAARDSGAATSCNLGSGGGSGTAPSTITISGSAFAPALQGNGIVDNAVPGATIAAYPATDPAGIGSALAITTTGANGTYSFAVPTGGVAFDGFLLVTDGSSYVPTYVWLPAQLNKDYGTAGVELISTGTENAATSLACSVPQSVSDALIAVTVVNASISGNSPLGGATVTSTPSAGKVCYDGSNGVPTGTASSTGSDGNAFVINVPAGNVMVSATLGGTTSGSATVCGVAGALTTTLISEQGLP